MSTSVKMIVKLVFSPEKGVEYEHDLLMKMVKKLCKQHLQCKVAILDVEAEDRDSTMSDEAVLAEAKRINPHLCEPSCGGCGNKWSECECSG